LEKEVAANQAALDQATAIRQKQLAEFNAEEKDLLESISALKAAVVVLSKPHPNSSLLQVPHSHLMGVAASLQHEMQKHAELLQGVLAHSQRKSVSAFLQAPQDYFDAAPTFKQSYAPQSGEIFGILKGMKESFETNLANAQEEEKEAVATFQTVKSSKTQEISTGQQQIDDKKTELADTDEKREQSK